MNLQDVFQILTVVLAFVATGASQFVEVRKKTTGRKCWWKNLTPWGKSLAVTFGISIILAVILTIFTISDNNRNTNTLSSIVDSLKNERKVLRQSDSARLRSTIDWLGQSYINIWLLPSMEHVSTLDSITYRNQLLDFTNTVLLELKNLSGNLALLDNKDLNAFLNSVGAVVGREKLTLYGYDFTSLKKVNDVLQLVGKKLREMPDNYAHESYYQTQKIDINLYPILKSIGDSAWVDK